MLVLSLAWTFQINSSMTVRQVELAAGAFAVRCAVIWFYREGRNWARLLAILYSAFALSRLIQLNKVEGLTRELWVAEAALGAFLFVFLLRGDVNAWFTRNQAPPAASERVAEALPEPLAELPEASVAPDAEL